MEVARTFFLALIGILAACIANLPSLSRASPLVLSAIASVNALHAPLSEELQKPSKDRPPCPPLHIDWLAEPNPVSLGPLFLILRPTLETLMELCLHPPTESTGPSTRSGTKASDADRLRGLWKNFKGYQWHCAIILQALSLLVLSAAVQQGLRVPTAWLPTATGHQSQAPLDTAVDGIKSALPVDPMARDAQFEQVMMRWWSVPDGLLGAERQRELQLVRPVVGETREVLLACINHACNREVVSIALRAEHRVRLSATVFKNVSDPPLCDVSPTSEEFFLHSIPTEANARCFLDQVHFLLRNAPLDAGVVTNNTANRGNRDASLRVMRDWLSATAYKAHQNVITQPANPDVAAANLAALPSLWSVPVMAQPWLLITVSLWHELYNMCESDGEHPPKTSPEALALQMKSCVLFDEFVSSADTRGIHAPGLVKEAALSLTQNDVPPLFDFTDRPL